MTFYMKPKYIKQIKAGPHFQSRGGCPKSRDPKCVAALACAHGLKGQKCVSITYKIFNPLGFKSNTELEIDD